MLGWLSLEVSLERLAQMRILGDARGFRAIPTALEPLHVPA